MLWIFQAYALNSANDLSISKNQRFLNYRRRALHRKSFSFHTAMAVTENPAYDVIASYQEFLQDHVNTRCILLPGMSH